ncbi:MAG: DUF4347 domain-containing protein [Spirulina sp. SIO3F2]|nr:DUF4347 domain-containing protein [Spirulina sp. SIO3F2]
MPLTPFKQTLVSLLAFTCLGLPQTAFAQSITAASDGTGTVINHNGNTYTITGGTQAGGNLFHSFQELGLAPNEIADFLSNPNIQNILGRVVGGNPSVIEGLIRLSGGNSNLYLMNPAGMVFTNGARLDVPGSFAATTATRIGFNNGFFNAYGENDYAALTGDPMSFIFDSETGTIFNEAMLEVPEGESLWLVGSSVLSTGTIEVENGNVTIAAIPEGNQIKLSHDGMILDLVLDAAPLGGEGLPGQIGLKPTDIPKYLTGGNQQNADTVVVAADGTVYLTQGGDLTPFQQGDVGIAGSVAAENVQLMAAGQVNAMNVELVEGDTTVVRFPGAGEPLALTAIDSTVDDYKRLLFGGQSGTIAFTIDPDENGISAITNQLADIAATGYQLNSLNIVAEGNGGNFWLGQDFVSHRNLAQYQTQLQQWQTGLGPNADLLLYSCLTAVGLPGEALVAGLAVATGMDVAASTNLTGSADLGGDWNLEYQTGTIEATTPFTTKTQAAYQGTLNTLTVETTADDTTTGNTNNNGLLNLREALYAANSNITVEGQTGSGTDTIRFDPIAFAGVQTITLANGQLNISDDATLVGTGQNNLAIDANNASRVFNITANTVSIKDIAMTNGNINGHGGGIQFFGTGTLSLENSTVAGNASTGGLGGGIFSNSGAVTLTNSTLSGNNAGLGAGVFSNVGAITLTNSNVSGNSSAGLGGGLVTASGAVTLTDSTVSGNSSAGQGGGVFTLSGAITATNGTVSGNSANTRGGGLFTLSGAIDLTDSTVSGNSSAGLGAGIYASSGAVTLTGSTVSGNAANSRGGGIYSFRGNVTANSSTVSGNTASGGGGIYTRDGGVNLNTSTVSNNSSSSFGGGIHARNAVRLTDSTVAGNTASSSGGGINSFTGTIELTNSTVSGNIANVGGGINTVTVNLTNSTVSGNSSSSASGGIRTSGSMIRNSTIAHNIAGTSGGGIDRWGGSGTIDIANSIIAENVAGAGNDLDGTFATIQNSLIGDTTGATIGTDLNNLIGVDPMLMPLGNYGGPTQTHALRVGSPAIDSGDNALVTMAMDQRGEARIIDGVVNMGAVEFVFIPPAPVVSPLTVTSTAPTLDTAEIQRSALDAIEETENLVDGVMSAKACRTVPKVTIEQEQDISFAEELETGERLELDADCDPMAIDITEGVVVSGR